MHYNVPWFTKHRPESDETSRYGNLVEVLLGLRSTGTSTGIIDCCLSSLSIHLPPTHSTTGNIRYISITLNLQCFFDFSSTAANSAPLLGQTRFKAFRGTADQPKGPAGPLRQGTTASVSGGPMKITDPSVRVPGRTTGPVLATGTDRGIRV